MIEVTHRAPAPVEDPRRRRSHATTDEYARARLAEALRREDADRGIFELPAVYAHRPRGLGHRLSSARRRVWLRMRQPDQDGRRCSFPAIARVCGYRSHSSVVTAMQRAQGTGHRAQAAGERSG